MKCCEQCPPLAMAVATELKNGVKLEKVTKLEFPIFPIAAAINWDSGIIKQQLKSLEWTKGNNKLILLLGVWLEAWLQYGCLMISGKKNILMLYSKIISNCTEFFYQC